MTVCLLVGTRLALTCRQKKVSRGACLRRQEVFWIGFWIGMAIVFKQSAVVYSLLIPFFLLYSLKGFFTRKSLSLLGLYLVGLVIPITLTVLYLISQNILAISYYQIIEYNIQSYHRSSISVMVNFIPHLLFPIVLLWVFKKLTFDKTKIKPYYLYFISSFIIAAIPLLLFRPYHHYWIPVLPYILLLL